MAEENMLGVHAQMKPECIEAFKTAPIENARQSLREIEVARFDVVRQADVLDEVYRTAKGAADRKNTDNYKNWCDTVAPKMAEPHCSGKLTPIHPDKGAW